MTALARPVMLAIALSSLACNGARDDGAPDATRNPTPTVDPANVELIPATAGTLLDVIRSTRGRAVLVNVWATWCIPCREEFPDIMRLYREHASEGLDLVLICADFDDQLDPARSFLAAQGVDFPTYLKVGKDMEFIDTLDPRWSGTLPASWVFDADGEARHSWENKASYEEIRARVIDVLQDNPTASSDDSH